MTDDRTRVLPATGVRVPAEPGYVLTNLHQMETRDGVAFNATVKVGKQVVGTIENRGDGGGTWFFPDVAGAREQFAGFVAGYVAANPGEDPAAEETVAELLFTEADLVRRFGRYLKRGAVLREPVEDPARWMADGTPCLTATGPLETIRADAARRGYEMFTPQGWVAA